jgi:uncharacterized protein DUF3606
VHFDYTLVDLTERWQVGYWTTALRCEEAALREAIAAVGPQVDDVRMHLARIRSEGMNAAI